MDTIHLYQKRCEAAAIRIQNLSSSKIRDSCKRTLLRLANSELRFLHRISHSLSRLPSSLSCNIGHLEAILHVLEQPSVKGVSRVCKPLPSSPGSTSSCSRKGDPGPGTLSKPVHVDIVCTLNKDPVWFVVSDRNPNYINWEDSHHNKSLRDRIELVLAAAVSCSTLKPSSVVLFFSRGLQNSVREKLVGEYGFSDFEFGVELSQFEFGLSEEVLDNEWVYVHSKSYAQACVLSVEIGQHPRASSSVPLKVEDHRVAEEDFIEPKQFTLGPSFCSTIAGMKVCSGYANDVDLISTRGESEEHILLNFDTTALVAIVSGISNGCARKLLNAPETELRDRFKNNTPFVIAQAMSEIENPIHADFQDIIAGKIGIICETVHTEFMGLVSMYSGLNEKSRALMLLKCIRVVPDCPSPRITSLPTTRKLDSKNKVLFGTGDYWHAPTLTANMGFVRAVSQTGMSLLTIEHRPRALTGD